MASFVCEGFVACEACWASAWENVATKINKDKTIFEKDFDIDAIIKTSEIKKDRLWSVIAQKTLEIYKN